MIDLLADTCNLTIGAKLTDDVSIVLALAKGHALINWLLRVAYDILKPQWSQFVPLILGCFESNTVRIIGACLYIIIINL